MKCCDRCAYNGAKLPLAQWRTRTDALRSSECALMSDWRVGSPSMRVILLSFRPKAAMISLTVWTGQDIMLFHGGCAAHAVGSL